MNEPLENLMAKARRGDLRAEERRRLELGLNASLEATLLYQAGCGFDQEPVVITGDETFLESIASEAVRRFGYSPPNAQRRASAVALVIWVASGMAAAGTIGVALHSARPFSSHAQKPNVAPAQTSAPKSAAPKPAFTGAASAQCAPSVKHPDPGQDQRLTWSFDDAAEWSKDHDAAEWSKDHHSSASLPMAATPPRQTVAALFQLANEARDNGRVDDAVRHYQRIQREYANSREALLSTMSLGMLELQRENPQAALPNFRRAYAANPTPEALWGEVQSLHQLGSDVEERQLLDQLLSRYPGSAYAPAARKRLGTED